MRICLPKKGICSTPGVLAFFPPLNLRSLISHYLFPSVRFFPNPEVIISYLYVGPGLFSPPDAMMEYANCIVSDNLVSQVARQLHPLLIDHNNILLDNFNRQVHANAQRVVNDSYKDIYKRIDKESNNVAQLSSCLDHILAHVSSLRREVHEQNIAAHHLRARCNTQVTTCSALSLSCVQNCCS